MTKFTKLKKMTTKNKKKKQTNLTIISKPHAHPHTMKKTPAKFQKDWYKCKRSCAHRTPSVNVDERTKPCTAKSPMLKQERQN